MRTDMLMINAHSDTIGASKSGEGATIREIVSALATEHTLALRASTKAALPRQNLTELRAMYARSSAD